MEPKVLATEERGKGPALVFVHGFPLSAAMWKEQVTGLPKHATCIGVDLRGHGMSEGLPTDGATIDLHADDLAATLDELGHDKIDLVALSMGGYVAFSFWRRHKDRVRSLILADTKAEADNDEAKAGRDATAALVRDQGMAPLWEKLKVGLLRDEPDPEVVAALEPIIMGCPAETAASDAIAMRDRADSTGDLASIDVPVTWIHGTQDKLMTLESAKASVEAIPNAKLVAIEDAGHMAPMEQPKHFNDAVLAHLEWVRG